jgi:hypothetical protein
MRIGGENKFGNLRHRHLVKFSERNNFSEEWVVAQFAQMAKQIPVALTELFNENKSIPAINKLRKPMMNGLRKYCEQVAIDLKLN